MVGYNVVERQTMVFNGDWNGGERRFNLSWSQRLDLQQLVRIDTETGERVEVRKDDIDRVDRYKWFENKTLR